MSPSPHDALFKATFEQPDVARSELHLVLPVDVRTHLDLDTLEVHPGSFQDDELHQSHTDLLYAVHTTQGQQAFVNVLFEHQSSFDATMPFRLLRYLVRIWERWQRDHEGTTTLPIIVPVVLHHGDGKWKAAPELASMLDASPALLDAVRPYQPHFRFILDDLSALPLEELADRALHLLGRIIQLAFRSSRSVDRLEHAAPVMSALVATLVRDERTRALLTQLYEYIWATVPREVADHDVQRILLSIAGPLGAEDVMNAGERLIERGRVEGELKGELKALRAAIISVLAARALPLSDSGRAMLASCTDIATLMQWHARAIKATSEAEVFAS